MEGKPIAHSCLKISQKASAQWSAGQNGHFAQNSADRHKIVPVGTPASRWPLATAGGVWGCLTRHSLPFQGKTKVFGAKPNTKRSSSEVLRQGARAENSGNSKQTQTWIITECSSGDVQVLRTVKNGVSTVAPL